MSTKLKSRKLWLAIAAAACAAIIALAGAIEWSQAIKIIMTSLGGYIGVEGLADALGRLGINLGGKK